MDNEFLLHGRTVAYEDESVVLANNDGVSLKDPHVCRKCINYSNKHLQANESI